MVVPNQVIDRLAPAQSSFESEASPAAEGAGLASMLQALLFVALLGSSEQWAEVDLTMPQLKLMLLLAEFGAAPVSWLAGRMNVSPPNITGILDRLEARSWVRRATDSRDRRVVRVELTSSGSKVLWGLCGSGSRKIAAGVPSLNRRDRDALQQGLSSLVATLTGG